MHILSERTLTSFLKLQFYIVPTQQYSIFRKYKKARDIPQQAWNPL